MLVREVLKEYLLERLKSLHEENQVYDGPCLDSASCEGGIVELEMLWLAVFQEDPPTKDKVLMSAGYEDSNELHQAAAELLDLVKKHELGQISEAELLREWMKFMRLADAYMKDLAKQMKLN